MRPQAWGSFDCPAAIRTHRRRGRRNALRGRPAQAIRAARPCVDVTTLNRLLHELEDEPVGGLLAVPLADALKRAESGAGLRAMSTESREGLWCAQTPQMFRYAILQHAFRNADCEKLTDE